MKMHHICIQTDCYEASKQFYMTILGFKLIQETPNFHMRAFNSWLELSGVMIELQTHKIGEALSDYNKNSKGIVHFALSTEDIDSEYHRIKKLGFDRFQKKEGQDIYEVKGGKLFKIKAPEGTIVEIRSNSGL
ncbi:VOC family protein [Fusibacter ferrireducens]|uniref:VOC family protein n=1 Tax=Fusibacter ferrireducens TaxID=2785058 RepID=A0ABR9ZNE4_9FIRM|nr:VOC family protein [Fusibacter ferrireducens]MBF4691992.1 VOC family protein [Fusibacter ferrireducens]